MSRFDNKVDQLRNEREIQVEGRWGLGNIIEYLWFFSDNAYKYNKLLGILKDIRIIIFIIQIKVYFHEEHTCRGPPGCSCQIRWWFRRRVWHTRGLSHSRFLVKNRPKTRILYLLYLDDDFACWGQPGCSCWCRWGYPRRVRHVWDPSQLLKKTCIICPVTMMTNSLIGDGAPGINWSGFWSII